MTNRKRSAATTHTLITFVTSHRGDPKAFETAPVR
jgi:hypothetical protein